MRLKDNKELKAESDSKIAQQRFEISELEKNIRDLKDEIEKIS